MSVQTSGQGGVAYPWDKWLSKKTMVLVKGEHYECMTHSMAQQVRNAARARGLRVSISISDNGLTVTSAKDV